MVLTRDQRLVLVSTTLDMFLEGVFVTLPSVSALLSSIPSWATPLVFSTIPVGTLIGNLALGRLTDLRGRKSTYMAMLGVYALGALLILAFNSLYAVLAGLLITQTAMGGEVPIVLSYIVESAPADIKERLVVLITNVGNVGAVVISAVALAFGGLSAASGRAAVGALVAGAIAIMAVTRSMVPESRPWLSLRPEERGRVVLGAEARLWLALLTLMAVSSVLTFGLLALSIGPEEFPSHALEIIMLYFAGEALGGLIAAAAMDRVGSRAFTLASFAGGFATSLAAIPALRAGLAPFMALLFVNGAFTETVWASRNVLESLSFPTTFRATGIALVRAAPYVLMLASFFATAGMGVVDFLWYATAMWALGLAASAAWMARGREVVGSPVAIRPEDLDRLRRRA
ncbi:putative major facilitator transporter [Acidilobus saccharovorans 345-15]|uniref:Putative major facilitator transporter n=1 Tax=Acidilobus saccharovorans (strain DSM 16705 / JCM 18335 / VKM B-2471 / 345-15) TaxID=666510 RepID=D9PZE0_ACIS3|nr:MFS transporter [Acidilobus saccharovorans]ADL18428.1 putative major facilitator transporter [Acidilobus saccharovorans 345-15]